jgi:vacuolar-type H+-ATPase subunit I/STV1
MLVEVLFMAHEMCLQRENISEIKADIKELQNGMLDLQIKSEGFSKDIESLVSQLANLTSWLRWLVILIAGGFITGAIGLIWKLVEARILF